jgi:hypothetical protein
LERAQKLAQKTDGGLARTHSNVTACRRRADLWLVRLRTHPRSALCHPSQAFWWALSTPAHRACEPAQNLVSFADANAQSPPARSPGKATFRWPRRP